MRLHIKRLYRIWLQNEKGFTLVELLVGIVVFSLILLIVTSWIGSWYELYQSSAASIQLEVAGQSALRLIEEDLVTCTEIVGIGDQLILKNSNQEQIRYFISDKQNLIRSVNGQGASVISTDVRDFQTDRIGSNGIRLLLMLERFKHKWERQTILSGRDIRKEDLHGTKANSDPN